MEQNRTFDPNEPVTDHTDTPYTRENTQDIPPVGQETPPAVQNIQTETHSVQAESHPARRIVAVVFSAIEVILIIRFFMKLLGANAQNTFIKIIYGATGFFVKLFEGIFSQVTISESSGAVFEPATLIAILIIALIAWGVLKLMKRHTGSSVVKTQYSGPAGQNDQHK
ncbi:MAG: YggT family protein [Clostridiales bacterium]|nr:YggT family protein [Clostridiales bacterium]